jgi:hypothetical protein
VARPARALDVLLARRAQLRAGAEGALVLQAAAVGLARLPEARDLDALVAALEAKGPDPGAGPRALPPATGGAGAVGEGGVAAARAAPAPGAEAAEAPGAQASLVAERWEAIVAAAARRDVLLGEALKRSRPAGLRGGRLVLRVPRGDALARSTLERRESVLAFRLSLREAAQVDLVPLVELHEAAPAPAPGAGPSEASLREHPAARAVAERTGGRLLGVRRAAPDAGPAG